MADKMEKPTAQAFSAGLAKETAAGPLQWSDKCFLCGNLIGESDPRGFYQGTAAMMLCHRGCLNTMNMHGGKPADYHRAMAPKQPEPEAPTGGPAWLHFPNMAALISYVKSKGDIPEHIKVTVAGQTIQGA